MQSIDSSTKEDKARPTSAATPKTIPKAKNVSRPSRPTSRGWRTATGNARDASGANDSEKKGEESQSNGQGFQTELIKKFFFTKIAEFDQGARQKPNHDREKNLVF